MITVHESAAAYEASKPVICPKCKRGKIGNIPKWSRAKISRRGKPPPEDHEDGLIVRCTVCNSYWVLTIE